MGYGRPDQGSRGGTRPCKKTQTPPALGLRVGRTPTPVRGLRAGGAERAGAVRPCLEARSVGGAGPRAAVGRAEPGSRFVRQPHAREGSGARTQAAGAGASARPQAPRGGGGR